MSDKIIIEPTTDEAILNYILTQPTIFNATRDDSSPETPESFGDMAKIVLSVPGFFLKAVVDGVLIGGWWAIWRGDSVETHTCLLPNCRGRMAITATKKAMRWVWDNTTAKAIISFAWSDSPQVEWFCRVVGLKFDRTEPWPATRNGKPVTISWFKLSREEI